MKALTVRQPWAECIARGAKLIENRTRGLSYRGPLAIHAGQAEDDRGWVDSHVLRELQPDRVGGVRGLHLAHGAVVAVAQLVDVHPAGPWPQGCGTACAPWGQVEQDRQLHHLVLADVQRLARLVPARGQLGLWDVDDELIAAAGVSSSRYVADGGS